MKGFLKEGLRRMGRALPFLLIAALVAAVCFFPKEETPIGPVSRVVRVWNVDTFEGGKGSRTAFLRRVADSVAREGVYFLISSYTVEGAREAASRGELPDAISYGIGLGGFLERCLPLPYAFSGGEVDGKTYAVPWCRGQYYLFSHTETFAGRTAISAGGSNLPCVAAAISAVSGEEMEPLAAYSGFLSGKYDLLLGTQRDVCRFQTRGAEVAMRPLAGYNDLYEVISVYSREKFEDCLAFLEALRGEKAQKALGEIGMLPFRREKAHGRRAYFPTIPPLRKCGARRPRKMPQKILTNFLKPFENYGGMW